MATDYNPLPVYRLEPDATFFRPVQPHAERLRADDPAVQAMTDLREVRAMTIGPNATLDSALAKMLRDEVHMLLVLDAHNRVLGIVTLHDLQGEKPLRFSQERHLRREEILVHDIMTPRDQLQVLHIEDVYKARVGHIVATLKRLERQHMVVTDRDPATSQVAIRGIFSALQLARQLGVTLDTTRMTAGTFAELEAALRRR